MPPMHGDRAVLTRYAWLSIAAALATIALKSGAYLLTGSVGLLSDALESLVNLVGGVVALAMLTIAARPADEGHTYGHSKAEYFSSGVEGGLILVAAAGIAYTSVERLLVPRAVEQIGLGLLVSVAASLVNLTVALILRKAGKRHTSITLEANARHLLTDVWTSAGVLVGVGCVGLTGLLALDPLIALVVAVNIVVSGVGIMRRSIQGLMDRAWPADDLKRLDGIFARYRGNDVEFHALRTRIAGARRFISVHVLVPGRWTVQEGHRLLETIEADIHREFAETTITTHLEPLDDPTSWQDIGLDRT